MFIGFLKNHGRTITRGIPINAPKWILEENHPLSLKIGVKKPNIIPIIADIRNSFGKK